MLSLSSLRYITSRFQSRFLSHAARITPFVASLFVCLACLMPADRSSIGDAFSTLPLPVKFTYGALGVAWLIHALLGGCDYGPTRTAHETLRITRWVLFLKASSYFAVLATCVYMYEGCNPAASLLCWMVMSSNALDHTIFNPGVTAMRLVANSLLLFGMAHRSRGSSRGGDQESLSSEWLLLSVLLNVTLAKVGPEGGEPLRIRGVVPPLAALS